MTDNIGQPAYQQLADDLRRLITDGSLNVGDAIPSTTQLCKQYRVSATVARAAVALLRTEGVVRGQAGKAVFVIATPQSVRAATHDLDSLARGLQEIRDKINLTEDLREPDSTTVDTLRAEVGQLRKQVARLETHLVDLYAKTGHNYPRDRAEPSVGESRRTAG